MHLTVKLKDGKKVEYPHTGPDSWHEFTIQYGVLVIAETNDHMSFNRAAYAAGLWESVITEAG